MSDTLTSPDLDERTRQIDEGDHDRFAHYIWGKNPKAQVTESMVTGTPIRALCGKKWVPSRDGTKFPVCPECKEIKARLQAGQG